MITSVARERTFHLKGVGRITYDHLCSQGEDFLLKGVGMITYDHRCSAGEDFSSEGGGDDYL